MKTKLTYLLILFASGILHLLILLLAWNLKLGKNTSLDSLVTILALSYLLNIMFFLLITGILKFRVKSQPEKENIADKKSGERNNPIIRKEVIDPKTLAEKMFKNVLLKRSIQDFGEKLLSNFAKELDIMQGVFYFRSSKNVRFEPVSTYAIVKNSGIQSFAPGEALPGEAILREEVTVLKNLPEGFRRIESGLGKLHPQYLYFVPLIHEKNQLGLIEISTFKEITENKVNALNYLVGLGGKKLGQFLEKINE